MSIQPDNLEALKSFATAAQEFCTFIESLKDGKPVNLYRTLEELLTRIHSAILPVRTERPDKEHPEFEQTEISHEVWRDFAGIIAQATNAEAEELIAWHASFKPDQSEPASDATIRASMLWDDLGDIYRDLRHGLQLWNLGYDDAQAEAAWQWRYIYEIHWGNHLFRAMTTIHEARYQLYAG